MERIEEELLGSTKGNTKGQGSRGAGGLLGNVSLLTTGGSSMQHLTADGIQLSTLQQTKSEIEKSKYIGTSTPARPFQVDKVMYGFDLSPVQSNEFKTVGNSGSIGASGLLNSTDQGKHSIEQEKQDDEMFLDSSIRPAPNFMQAPLVASPHQSRSGITPEKIRNNETDTMMQQVYAITHAKNVMPKKTSGKKKKTPNLALGIQSPSFGKVSPRKSSKRYSHVKGSGYGSTSPVKQTTTKSMVSNRDPPVNNIHSGTRKRSVFTDNYDIAATDSYSPYVHQINRDTNMGTNFSESLLKNSLATADHEIEKVDAGQRQTFKVPQKNTNGNTSQTNDITITDNLKADDTEAQIKLELFEVQLNTLRDECNMLKENNAQINQEKFLLSAKLNKMAASYAEKPKIHHKKDSKDIKGENDDDETEELRRLKKDLLEQEHLIQGYQQENERVYKSLVKAKQESQENELSMYEENLKLKRELASLKEELVIKDGVIKDKNLLILQSNSTYVQKINRSLQTDEDFSRLQKRVSFECAEHQKKISELDDKVSQCKLYHSTFDLDHERLVKSENELVTLRSQVAKMKKQLLAKNETRKESQLVQDLRRQIKEMELIVTKQQHSDHVTNLIHGEEQSGFWEERAKKLQAQLSEQKQHSDQGIKSLQQLYTKMRLEYEGRVDELAKQLEIVKLSTQNHQPKQTADANAETKIIQLQLENENLQSRVENLSESLASERRSFQTKLSAYKKKIKTADTKTYHPGYFATLPKSELREITNNNVETTKAVPAIGNKHEVELTKEVGKWRHLYEQEKSDFECFKTEQNKQLSSINSSHQETVQQLEFTLKKMQVQMEENHSVLETTRAEQLSLQSREKALQFQIKCLLDELHETRSGSPNALIRKLATLQSQVSSLDLRQRAREDKLNSALNKNADACLRDEIRNLKSLVGEKNLLLTKFRVELDAILVVLESLQSSPQTVSVT